MKIETYLLLAIVLFGIWRTNCNVKRAQTAGERGFVLRTSIFAWFIGVILFAALLFLPNKVRLLLLIPVFFGALSFARLVRDARARLRRRPEDQVDIERMKRVN